MGIFEQKDLPLKRAGGGGWRTLWPPVAAGVLAVVLAIGAIYLAAKRIAAHLQEKQENQARIQPAPAQQAPEQMRLMLAECRALAEKNDLETAAEKCAQILSSATDPACRREAEELLGSLNITMATTPCPTKNKIEYIVEKGDTLERIAKRHNTTVELIAKSNAIRGHIIRPGDKLRIFTARFEIHINKQLNELTLMANGAFFKRYKIGTGKHDSTPEGEFIISDKIPEPPWWRPDGKVIPYGAPENILGTRWLAITATGDTPPAKGYGIHGTWAPETVGSASSAGCIRMYNRDVEELFMLVPVGTKVVITK